MIYVKIDDKKYLCTFQSCKTQAGKDVARIISSEAPIAENGFMIVDEDDNLIANKSDYVNLYRQEGDVKEYTVEKEEIIPCKFYEKGDVPPSSVSKQISSINKRLTDITPYVETKTAYIDDTEIVFENEKEGSVLVSAIDGDGNSVDVLCKREGNNVIVSFLKPLEQVTKVTLSIQ